MSAPLRLNPAAVAADPGVTSLPAYARHAYQALLVAAARSGRHMAWEAARRTVSRLPVPAGARDALDVLADHGWISLTRWEVDGTEYLELEVLTPGLREGAEHFAGSMADAWQAEAVIGADVADRYGALGNMTAAQWDELVAWVAKGGA